MVNNKEEKRLQIRNSTVDFLVFTKQNSEDGIEVRVQDETVWLSVSQMAILFNREESNIRRHVLNVFKENEVEENNNVQKIHVNNVKKPVPFYSLDVIISVGYRVESNRGVEFRRWANSVLKQYILQGCAVNQKRIQQLGEVIRIMKRTEDGRLFSKEEYGSDGIRCRAVLLAGCTETLRCILQEHISVSGIGSFGLTVQ